MLIVFHLFLQILEQHVSRETEICCDSFFNIAYSIEEEESIPLIGCVDHAHSLTSRLIHTFLITRMYFKAKYFNLKFKASVEGKNLKKLSKLK